MKNNKNYSFRALVLNPLILVIYGITCFYLSSLLQYGGVRRRVPIILAGATILLIWFVWCIYKSRKHRESTSTSGGNYLKVWYYIGLFILISTTVVTGTNIYKSGTNFQGKLAWFIHDLKNKREIEFIHDNIYYDGLEGLFKDLEEKIPLPEELYVANEFRLKFDKDGGIHQIYAYLYGKDEEEETQSFLISYDRNKSGDMIVYLNGYVDADFNEERKLQPLLDVIQWLPLEETVNNWHEERYGILYTGVRNWGYNTEGIVYIDEKDKAKELNTPENEIIGYTVSVYVPGKEDIITPQRFIHNGLNVSPEEDDVHAIQWEMGYNYNDGEETFFIDEKLGYQLSVMDAALGSRFYGLLQTQDGGITWDTINPDPFLDNTGVSSGITFINEELGFIGLSHNGGSEAELYRTIDGGLSFEEVLIPEVKVPLTENETHHPFDFPDMPYEENGELYLLVGQGMDGDYKGGIKALYQSSDNGQTWVYVREEM